MTTPTPQPFTGPVGVGFIGAGVISDQYLTNLTAFPDVKVLILGDLDTERAAAQADDDGAPLRPAELASTPRGDVLSHRVQFADDSVPEDVNVYLDGWLGQTRFRQLLSPGADPTARWTTAGQRTDPALHPEHFEQVVVADGSAPLRTAPLPGPQPRHQDARETAAHEASGAGPATARHPHGVPAPLTADAARPREYALLSASGAPSARFRYLARKGDPDADTAELHLVPRVTESLEPCPAHPVERARFTVAALTGWRDLPTLARRLAIVAEVEEIRLVVEDPAVTAEQLHELTTLEWPLISLDGAPPEHRA